MATVDTAPEIPPHIAVRDLDMDEVRAQIEAQEKQS